MIERFSKDEAVASLNEIIDFSIRASQVFSELKARCEALKMEVRAGSDPISDLSSMRIAALIDGFEDAVNQIINTGTEDDITDWGANQAIDPRRRTG